MFSMILTSLERDYSIPTSPSSSSSGLSSSCKQQSDVTSPLSSGSRSSSSSSSTRATSYLSSYSILGNYSSNRQPASPSQSSSLSPSTKNTSNHSRVSPSKGNTPQHSSPKSTSVENHHQQHTTSTSTTIASPTSRTVITASPKSVEIESDSPPISPNTGNKRLSHPHNNKENHNSRSKTDDDIVVYDDVRVLTKGLVPKKSCLKKQPIPPPKIVTKTPVSKSKRNSSDKKSHHKRYSSTSSLSSSSSSESSSNRNSSMQERKERERKVQFPKTKDELAIIVGTVTIYYEMTPEEVSNTWYKVKDIESFRLQGKLIATELRTKHAQTLVKQIDSLYSNVQYIANTTKTDQALYSLLQSLRDDDNDDSSSSTMLADPITFENDDDIDDDVNLFMDDNRIMNTNLINLYLQGFNVWSQTPKPTPKTQRPLSKSVTNVPSSPTNNSATSFFRRSLPILSSSSSSPTPPSPTTVKETSATTSDSKPATTTAKSGDSPLIICGRGLEHWTSKRYHTCRREVMTESRRAVVELWERLEKHKFLDYDQEARAEYNIQQLAAKYKEYTRASRILARIYGASDFNTVQQLYLDDIETEQMNKVSSSPKQRQQQQHSADTKIITPTNTSPKNQQTPSPKSRLTLTPFKSTNGTTSPSTNSPTRNLTVPNLLSPKSGKISVRHYYSNNNQQPPESTFSKSSKAAAAASSSSLWNDSLVTI